MFLGARDLINVPRDLLLLPSLQNVVTLCGTLTLFLLGLWGNAWELRGRGQIRSPSVTFDLDLVLQ